MKTRRATSRELIGFLEGRGWKVVRQRGSHKILRHPERLGLAVVPHHGAKTLRPGTLSAILKAVNIPPDEFNDMM